MNEHRWARRRRSAVVATGMCAAFGCEQGGAEPAPLHSGNLRIPPVVESIAARRDEARRLQQEIGALVAKATTDGLTFRSIWSRGEDGGIRLWWFLRRGRDGTRLSLACEATRDPVDSTGSSWWWAGLSEWSVSDTASGPMTLLRTRLILPSFLRGLPPAANGTLQSLPIAASPHSVCGRVPALLLARCDERELAVAGVAGTSRIDVCRIETQFPRSDGASHVEPALIGPPDGGALPSCLSDLFFSDPGLECVSNPVASLRFIDHAKEGAAQ